MDKDVQIGFEGLSREEIEELIQLSEEPSDKDVVSSKEYEKVTERWRAKS